MYHDSANFLLKIYAGTIQRVKTIQVFDNIDLLKEKRKTQILHRTISYEWYNELESLSIKEA